MNGRAAQEKVEMSGNAWDIAPLPTVDHRRAGQIKPDAIGAELLQKE
jgi:hypothetical protein